MYSKMQKRLARCARTGLVLRTPLAPIITISPGSTSRTNSAPMMSRAQVSDARIHASPSWPSTERPHAERIAHADDAFLRQRDQRIGALDLAQRVDQPLHDGVLEAGRDQVDDDLGVAGRLEQAAAAHELAAQLIGIGEIAVVADRQAAELEDRRTAAGCCAARPRRSSHSAHGRSRSGPRSRPITSFELKLSPTWPMPRCGVELLAVIGDDAGRLLAAMLQRVQAKGGERGTPRHGRKRRTRRIPRADGPCPKSRNCSVRDRSRASAILASVFVKWLPREPNASAKPCRSLLSARCRSAGSTRAGRPACSSARARPATLAGSGRQDWRARRIASRADFAWPSARWASSAIEALRNCGDSGKIPRSASAPCASSGWLLASRSQAGRSFGGRVMSTRKYATDTSTAPRTTPKISPRVRSIGDNALHCARRAT